METMRCASSSQWADAAVLGPVDSVEPKIRTKPTSAHRLQVASCQRIGDSSP